MAAPSSPTIPTPTPEQRRIASENFERARQVILSGNFDYGISLLKTCCQLDPANVSFRHTLRKAQKDKFGNNLRGSRLAFVTSSGHRAKLKAARASRDHLKVLEYGEEILTRDPWDLGAQMDMSEAFDALGLLDLAVLTLDQARQKYPKDPTLNRALARLFEKRGNFDKAIVLWSMVKDAVPSDVEAAHKAKDLAASDTIARGRYEETAANAEASPIAAKMEAMAAAERVDKVGKEANPILKRIEAAPTEPTLYIQLANVYRKHGETDRARNALEQGLGATGHHFSLQIEIVELDLIPLRKNLELVEKKLAKYQSDDYEPGDDDPTEADLEKLKNKLLKEITTRELDVLRVRAERFPNDLTHKMELGVRLMKADKLDEAIAELQQARRDEKLKGRAAMYLGNCFRKRNNWRLAQRNYEEALQALATGDDSARKEVLFQLATGCAENNDIPRALDLGHELANLDFSYKNIGNLIDEWEAQKA